MTRKLALAAALIVALSACGGRQALKPREGQAAVPIPRGASAAPTAQNLMQPSTQARPERNAELLLRSKERTDDAFDLPPENR
ncbi:hypothetical protein BH10PSE12_BH10PSE12_25990 [soil metagenome]